MRYLQVRSGLYRYYRRVPLILKGVDERFPFVRIALKTSDLRVAIAKRDAFEHADNELWASYMGGQGVDAALARYRTAVKLAEAMGFSYRPAAQIADAESIEEILKRFGAIGGRDAPAAVINAALGLVDKPAITVSQAFEIYQKEIVADTLLGKSQKQRRSWKNIKQHSVELFVELVGDKPIADVTRADAKRIYDHWRERIAPAEGIPTHTASIGNRHLGNLRVLYGEYFSHLGEDRKNPFADFSFSEKVRRKRPAFQPEHLLVFLKPGALGAMNDQARGIFLTVIETGCRPSEVANLKPDHIFLDHEVPHISVEPSIDPEDPREIKNYNSVRRIPLIGVALAAMRAFPNGFDKYRDNNDTLSAALNKFLRQNGLMPSIKHTVYSARHAFEDRMKMANIDAELRKILMGHGIDRPEYGEGGSLAWRLEQLKRIELPFDPAIVSLSRGRRTSRPDR
jgi:integrase